MDTMIYTTLALAYIGLFIYGISAVRRGPWRFLSSTILLIILGLIYDNGVLAIGKYLGESELLKTVHLLRYWLHALFTPLLVLFSWNLLKKARVEWAFSKWMKIIAVLITIGLILSELIFEVFGLTLKAQWQYGVLNYQPTESSMPIMIIGVSAVLLITSLIIWYKEKWIGLFIGVALLSIGHFIKFPVETATASNIYELILMTALLVTDRYVSK